MLRPGISFCPLHRSGVSLRDDSLVPGERAIPTMTVTCSAPSHSRMIVFSDHYDVDLWSGATLAQDLNPWADFGVREQCEHPLIRGTGWARIHAGLVPNSTPRLSRFAGDSVAVGYGACSDVCYRMCME